MNVLMSHIPKVTGSNPVPPIPDRPLRGERSEETKRSRIEDPEAAIGCADEGCPFEIYPNLACDLAPNFSIPEGFCSNL